MASKFIVYGACPGGPSDFKSGVTVTSNITNGVISFSQPQLALTMGIGAEVTYNDGSNKKGYIVGKITTTDWMIRDREGLLPANCTGATVSIITHPYAAATLAESGFTDANHINNTSLVAADIDVHIACYCEQTTFTADGNLLTIGGFTSGPNHRFFVYSPTDTKNQCNLSMFTPGRWDLTKYRLELSTSYPLLFSNNESHYATIKNLQIRNTSPLATSRGAAACSSSATVNVEFVGNILVSDGVADCLRTSFSISPTADSVINIVNNIMICNGGTHQVSTGVGGVRIGSTSSGLTNIFSNTIYGFYTPISRGLGTVVTRNNAFLFNVAVSTSGVDRDYNVSTRAEVETNGFRTAQTLEQLIESVGGNALANNWAPKKGSDLVDRGTELGHPFNVDMFGVKRPQNGKYDCGAVELKQSKALGVGYDYSHGFGF